MRITLAIILLAVVSFDCFGQKKIVLNKNDDELIYTVKRLILQQDSGIIHSWDIKDNSRLGDKISVALLKIYTKDEIYDQANINRFLPIIRAAFSFPEVLSAQERTPKVTLPLLSRLESKTADPELKKKILEVSEFVKKKTSGQKIN